MTTETIARASRLGRLAARMDAQRAAWEAAKQRAAELANELRGVEDEWAGATAETMTPEAFATLSARRELLLRSLGRARVAAGALEAGALTARNDYGIAAQSRLNLLRDLERAERNGNTNEARRCQTALAALVGEGPN